MYDLLVSPHSMAVDAMDGYPRIGWVEMVFLVGMIALTVYKPGV